MLELWRRRKYLLDAYLATPTILAKIGMMQESKITGKPPDEEQWLYWLRPEKTEAEVKEDENETVRNLFVRQMNA